MIFLWDERGVDQLVTSNEDVKYDIEKLFTIMSDISRIHKHFSEINSLINEVNLKRTQVRHILRKIEETDTFIIEHDFLNTLKAYLSELDFLIIDTDLEYTYSDVDLRLRVKQPESIIYKLGHYNDGKLERGRIAINKCLNDLLGFRISLPNFNHYCETFQKMCKMFKYTYKIRYINSSKGEYRATHMYFYGESNRYFPWELQIWLPEDFKLNYISHAAHKQEYIKSAKIHKEAFI